MQLPKADSEAASIVLLQPRWIEQWRKTAVYTGRPAAAKRVLQDQIGHPLKPWSGDRRMKCRYFASHALPDAGIAVCAPSDGESSQDFTHVDTIFVVFFSAKISSAERWLHNLPVNNEINLS